MTEFLVQPAGVRLTWSLVHFLWQGAAIAALLMFVLRSMTTLQPRGRYLLSMAALGLMAICPLATWCVLGELELPAMTRPSLADSQSVGLSFEAHASAAPAGENRMTFQQLIPALQPYLLFAWLLGVLLLGARLVSGYVGTLWLKSGRTAVPLDLARRAIVIGRRLGVDATGRVFSCSRVPEAVAIGFWKPIVLLPVCWLTELPSNVLEAVIAHELAHVRRWDLWAMLAQRVIETLLFYHPAVWWLSRRVSLEREICCDELAVLATGRPVVYAQVLEYLGGRTAAVTSLALATSFKGERDMNLLTRVQHVLGMRTRPETGRVWLAGLLSLAMVLGILAISTGQIARRAEADEPPAKPREGDRAERDGDAPRREGQLRRAAEVRDGERHKETNNLEGFKPQNDREESLYQMILQLQRQTAELQRQVNQMRGGTKEGSAKETTRRDANKREGGVNSDAGRVRNITIGERNFDVKGSPARDGDAPTRREARDGDEKKAGPRDGEKRRETGPRDGEGDKPKARDGEDRKPGPRDGDERKTGPRDGEGDKPKARDDEERKDRPRDGDRSDRPTLLRRLALDLTGQLPTPEEVRAFTRDPASDEEAYARVVQRFQNNLKAE